MGALNALGTISLSSCIPSWVFRLTIFQVFSMTRLRIEWQSPSLMASKPPVDMSLKSG